MQRGRRSNTSSKILRGTVEKAREREYRDTAIPVPKTVRDEMRKTPKGLTTSQRRLYQNTVKVAPWLTPTDLTTLVLWVKAADAAMHAEDLSKVVKQVSMATQLGKQLGLTPSGRRSLGIEREDVAAATPVPNDPWDELRLVRGGRE